VSEPINDIDGLLFLLSDPHHSRYSTALRMLVAERNALKERVAELEANPPADRDRELRERLICTALEGACSQDGWVSQEAIANHVVGIANATLAAMRKGEADGK
jgi:hypothetical protein